MQTTETSTDEQNVKKRITGQCLAKTLVSTLDLRVKTKRVQAILNKHPSIQICRPFKGPYLSLRFIERRLKWVKDHVFIPIWF